MASCRYLGKQFIALALIFGLTPMASALSKSKDEVLKAERTDSSPAPCVNWVDPLSPPHAALLCIHGLGLNSDAFANFGRRLSHRGIAVYAIDVRGFGSWTKAGGNQKLDFDGTISDIKNTLDIIHQASPGLPVFLLGESMGGAIAIRAASLYPDSIQGLISAVPAGDRFGGKKEDLKVAVETIEHGFRKQFDIGKSIVNQATKNKDQKEVWENDPLNRMDLSPLQLMQFQHFMDDNVHAAKKITSIPVLIVQGSQDKLVKPEGSWDIFNAMKNPEKSFLAFPSEHLIFEYGGTKTVAEARKSAQIAAVWIFEHLPESDRKNVNSLMAKSFVARPEGRGDGLEVDSNTRQTSDAMRAAEALYASAKFDQAIPALEAVIAAEPTNVDAHVWLGLSYERTGQTRQAMGEALKARQLSKSDRESERANEVYTQLSADPNSQLFGQNAAKDAALTRGLPTVLIFGAPWCAESSSDDGMIAHGTKYFGTSVQFKKINIDDAANADIVREFNVGPIPTYIFLSNDGSVKSTQIGHSNFANFVIGVQGISH
jgi:alpha-beta hydrolase superfamily lysophospholipase